MDDVVRECAAIVAWLRGGSTRPSVLEYYEDMRSEYPHDLADMIERGAHLAGGSQ